MPGHAGSLKRFNEGVRHERPTRAFGTKSSGAPAGMYWNGEKLYGVKWQLLKRNHGPSEREIRERYHNRRTVVCASSTGENVKTLLPIKPRPPARSGCKEFSRSGRRDKRRTTILFSDRVAAGAPAQTRSRRDAPKIPPATLEKIIAGSTAEGMIKAADCSLLIVKPPHSAAQHPQWQSC